MIKQLKMRKRRTRVTLYKLAQTHFCPEEVQQVQHTGVNASTSGTKLHSRTYTGPNLGYTWGQIHDRTDTSSYNLHATHA